ncbi:MAG: hypothetical protein OEY91_13250 [Nitrospirota bacterium]|nr:hypothetical protein [Nitrospirota bacterium]
MIMLVHRSGTLSFRPITPATVLPHIEHGAVEKSRQRRSRQFSVLTYWKYAPRAKPAAALLDELF